MLAILFAAGSPWCFSEACAQRALGPPGTVFRDCESCPDMGVVPAGSALIGSSPEETSREGVPAKFAAREWPRHTVAIRAPIAMGKTEVTRAQFARFADETQRPAGDGCFVWDFEG